MSTEIENELKESEEMFQIEHARQERIYQQRLNEWTRRYNSFLEAKSRQLPSQSEQSDTKNKEVNETDEESEEKLECEPRLADYQSNEVINIEKAQSKGEKYKNISTKKKKKESWIQSPSFSRHIKKNRAHSSDHDLNISIGDQEKLVNQDDQNTPITKARKKITKITKIPQIEDDFDEPRPIEPHLHKFSGKKLQNRISKRLESSFRPSSTPILNFRIEHNVTITDTLSCPKVYCQHFLFSE